jgi:hypothetical protein
VQSAEHGPPNDISSTVKNKEEMNRVLRASKEYQSGAPILKDQLSYRLLLKAIEPAEGEPSPERNIQTNMRPSNIYTESSETLLEEESNITPNRSETRGSVLGL